MITSRIVMTAGHCVADSDPDCSLWGENPVCTVLSDPSPGDGTCKLDPDDVDVILGRSTLTDHSQGAEVTVQAVKLGTNFNGDFQGDGVPRFDAAYLVLSAPSSQVPIKIAGTDEGALWDAGSLEEISGWGSTGVLGSPVNGLRAATVNVIPDSTCNGDYGSDFDAATMVCAGFQERRCRHLLRRQRRATPGSAPGRRLSPGRHHRAGVTVVPSRLPGCLYACRGSGDAVADRLGRIEPGDRSGSPSGGHLRQRRPAALQQCFDGRNRQSEGAEEVQADPQQEEAASLYEEGEGEEPSRPVS